MKNILSKTKNQKYTNIIALAFAVALFPAISAQAYSSYTPSYSSSPSSSYSSYTPSYSSGSGGSSYSSYTPSYSSGSGGSSYSSYTPSYGSGSDYSYSSYTPSYGSGSDYSYSSYTPSYGSGSDYNYSSYTPSYGSGSDYNYSSYTPSYSYGSDTGGYSYGCSSGNCSSGGYSYSPTQDYISSYLPQQSSGCSGSSCGGGGRGSAGGALGLNLNYSDNDTTTTITDNSVTDNSVKISNSSTTTTTTNTCSNGNNASSSGNCNTVNNYVAVKDVEKEKDLEVICRVSETRIEKGDTVTFEVDIRGGKPSFRIEWDGAISGDDVKETARFNKSGTYRVTVEVRDANGDRDSDECVVKVDDEDDNKQITVTTSTNLGTPTGNLASLDSVFLSQVPYTGPGDIVEALGILAVIAVWSTVAAAYLKKKRALKTVSNKITNFKELNKNSNKIA